MRRLTTILFSLAVLVLSTAATQGAPLGGASSGVEMNMAPQALASIVPVNSQLYLGVLTGAPGVYWVGEDGFGHVGSNSKGYRLAFDVGQMSPATRWTDIFPQVRVPGEGAKLTITSNVNVRVTMAFSPLNWLNSPAFFGVYDPTANPAQPSMRYIAHFGYGDVYRNAAQLHQSSDWFMHQANKGPVTYSIDLAVYIRAINEQAAGLYTGEILVTLDQVGNKNP